MSVPIGSASKWMEKEESLKDREDGGGKITCCWMQFLEYNDCTYSNIMYKCVE